MGNQERKELKKANPSKKWAEEVDKMREEQVIETYIRLRAQRKLKR